MIEIKLLVKGSYELIHSYCHVGRFLSVHGHDGLFTSGVKVSHGGGSRLEVFCLRVGRGVKGIGLVKIIRV